MLITGLCIVSIFLLIVVAIFVLFLIYGCFTMQSQEESASRILPNSSKYDPVQDEDFIEQEEHDHHDAAVDVSTEDSKRESNIRINRNTDGQ